MDRKLNVAVLMGGRTAEHEVSLATGQMVVRTLDRSKYNIKPIIITKEGRWLLPGGYLRQLDSPEAEWTVEEQFYGRALVSLSAGYALDKAVEEKVDVVFIAMHGPFGEDGTVQGLLEMLDIPYTGSNVLASSLAMNKVKSREIFMNYELLGPAYLALDLWQWRRAQEEIVSRIARDLGFPCVLKPAELGSSVGVRIAKSGEELVSCVESALEYGPEILAEEYLEGDEITCAVLGAPPGEEPIALAPTQIIPKMDAFFDYHAKYTPDATEEITPAQIGDRLIARAQEIAVIAHKALGCGGLSRTDMIVRDGEIYVLELNTIPGMTEMSLYPQAAKAVGLPFSKVLDRIIELALVYHKTKQPRTGL